RRHRSQLLLGAVDRRFRLQPRDDVPVARPESAAVEVLECFGCVHFARARTLEQIRIEPLWQYANNNERTLFELDDAADDARVAAEQPLPAAVTQYGDVGAAGDVFLRSEGAAKQRHDAERLEEPLGDQTAKQRFWLRASEVVETERLDGGDGLARTGALE